jgi:triphosphoribosyl-dephospho-CoA synthase
MPSGASASELLVARDRRAALIGALRAGRPSGAAAGPPRSLLFASLAIPGAEKSPPGAGIALAAGVEAARRALGPEAWEELDRGLDVLGPWAAVEFAAEPGAVKRLAAGVEASLPFGRLLDLDVYVDGGRPLDRAALGLPQRTCLVCAEPARECIRAARHPASALAARVAELLEPLTPWRSPAAALGAALVRGACEELDLTPKPGLVDRLDCGSHPDLSYDVMRRSVDLLPLYFDELVALRGGADGPGDLGACIAAGRWAEARMRRSAGSNAHRGFIFLGGLLVLAACDAVRAGEATDEPALRRRTADLAAAFVAATAPAREDTPGARARRAHGVAGILGEALAGAPSVFGAALPAFRATLGASGDRRRAALRAMAALMERVEDTTALHRAGAAGLARIRRDGARLAALLDAGEDPDARLAEWNDDYRRERLTMGGVADCLAVTLALAGAAAG